MLSSGGREKDDIVPWLKEHKNIKFVARDRASSYAEAIDEVLPNTVQVADRFHLFENIIKYLKEMFYSELPDKIVIKDNEILDKKATKIISELANIDWDIVDSFSYTNDVPIDENGEEIKLIDVEYDLNDERHLAQTERRMKKYNIAVKIRNESDLSIDDLSEKYDVSQYLVKKYLKMSNEEVEQIKTKRNYNRKETEFSKYKNIVYKMLMDGQPLEYILAYILKNGCDKKIITLKRIISNVAKNNGIAEIKFTGYSKTEYPSDETIIKRRDLLKYLLTINEKIKDQIIESNIEIIKEKYPIVSQIQTTFKNFHDAIFSDDENKLDDFIETYKDILPSFCNRIKKDITAVKNAISNEINSGFVEGNNNKFKLIKRIVYGKQKICNLFKRCFLAFTSTLDDLSLVKLAIAPLINK